VADYGDDVLNEILNSPDYASTSDDVKQLVAHQWKQGMPDPDATSTRVPPDSLFNMVSKGYQSAQKAGNIPDSEDTDKPASVSTPSNIEQDLPKQKSSPEEVKPAGASQKKDYLGNLLQQLYGSPDVSNSGLDAAVAGRNANVKNALLLQAANGIGNALNKGRGLYEKPDNALTDALMAQANRPVQDVMNKQAFMNERLNTAVKASDFLDAAKLQDPDSDVSKAFRGVAARLNPTLADSPNFEDMSAQVLKQAEPMVDSAGRMMYYQSLKQDQVQRNQEKMYAQAKVKAGTGLENLMSKRGPVGNAEQVDQSADRLLTLLNSGRELTREDMATAANDLDAIYRGGTATVSGAAKIIPDTLGSNIAKGAQFLTGKPKSAELQQFQERYKLMAQEVKTVAKQYKLQHLGNFLEANKRALAPEDYQDLSNRYIKPLQSDLEDSNSNIVTINGIPHQVPPGTDMDKLKQTVESAGGKFGK
jgi:hypothetical protein